MGTQMNAATAAAQEPNVYPIRREPPAVSTDTTPEERGELSRLGRFLHNLGAIEMANTSSTKPPGFYLNYSTVLFYITVLGFIAGGFYWTWQRGDESGYKRRDQEAVIEKLKAEQAAELKKLNDRLAGAEAQANNAQKTAQDAKDIHLAK